MTSTTRPADQRYRGKVGAMLRQDDALAAWIKGATYSVIAEKLGYSGKAAAYNAVTAALGRHNSEAEDRAALGRAIALERLRPLWVKALALVEGPDGCAKDVMAAAQIADRLQRLEGVKDPAQEVRLSVETELDREIKDLMAALSRAGVDPAVVLRDPARG